MNNRPFCSTHTETFDFRAFEATPGISVIVLPDAPVYTHVAVSNDFLLTTGFKKEQVIGKGHFEVFPQNPEDSNFTGKHNLKTSFEHIIRNKKPHQLPIQRYDIPTEDGSFVERYWKVSNAPILSKEGEVLFIVHSAYDVTDLIKSEQQSKKTTQFIVDNAPVGIIIYDALRDQKGSILDFEMKYYNALSNELTGFTNQERGNYTYQQIASALGNASLFDAFIEVVEKNISFKKELYIKRTNRWVLYSGTKYEDGFLATIIDITDLKASETALQNEISFSKGIFNASLNGIYVMRANRNEVGQIEDFTVLQVNNKFAELTGWPIEALIGKSFLTTFPSSRNSGLFNMLCEVVKSGISNREMTYYAATLGRWYDYIAVRLGEDNVVVTFQEITQIKENAILIEQQKQMLDNILQNSPSGIAVYEGVRDAKGKVTDFQCILANESTALYTQVSNKDRLTKRVSEITPGLRESQILQMAIGTLETGQPFQTQFYRQEIKKWLDLSIVRMDENHLINVFTDITVTKEAQIGLEQTIEELKRSNEELEQFAYVASHDLQEPLRKIRVFNDLLIGKMAPENELRKYIDKVDESAKRMSGLIHSLLEYSRLSKSGSRFESVDLNGVLNNVLADYELLISQKRADIQRDSLPTITAIPLQMNQLLFNLIGNALKFTKRDIAPIITIKCETISKERKAQFSQLRPLQEYVQITIRDNGIGFNQEYANQIFTIFQRLNDRSVYGGYGIGLALCKRVVDNHQGIIYAEGTPKQGACFTVILPYKS
jgi:signal transduction histidine kinase